MTGIPPRPPAPRRTENGTSTLGTQARPSSYVRPAPAAANQTKPQPAQGYTMGGARPSAPMPPTGIRPAPPSPPRPQASSPRPPMAPLPVRGPAAAPARPATTTVAKTTAATAAPTGPKKKGGFGAASGGFAAASQFEDDDTDLDNFSVGSANEVVEAVEVTEIPADQKLDEVKGSVQRVIFSTPDGFAVYAVRAKDKQGRSNDITIQVIGNIKFHRHDKIMAKGSWGTYKGRETFKAVIMIQEIPQGAKGVVAWLKTKVVSGVGQATARTIATYFGDELPNVIGDPEELMKSGIPRDKADKIAEAWNNNASQPELMEFLGRFPIGERTIAKIIKRYGAACRRIVESNPWKLAETIEGISFTKADEIAQIMGHDMKSPERLKAGIRASLEQKTGSEGHCGLPRDILILEAIALLKVDREIIDLQIDAILEDNTVVQPEGSDLIYPLALYTAEQKLVDCIDTLMEQGDYIEEDDARQAVEEVIKELGVRRDESQVNAAIMAICNPVSIITGGPGTGKSTTQKVIVAALKRLGRTLMAAAPTGRAAKRLTEVSQMDASTCHRLLKYDAKAGGFLHSKSNPFTVQRLIVDEFSMVDIKIAASFFEAIKPTAGITIVGDVDQLPSVGAGQVLRDLIESGVIPVTRLQTVHRQSGDSGIVVAAAMINRGEYPDVSANKIDGFELIDNFRDRNDEQAIRRTVVNLMAERLPAMGYNPLDDVQVLTPMRITDLGINVLNDDLKNRMNPMTEENGINMGNQDWSKGDRVMHTRNDYEKSVFNGEVGFVDFIGERTNENGSKEPFIRVDYDGHKAFYTRADVSDIIPAWAATVHKSQGCEFPVAIVVCSNAHKRMLTRNLIYTAVTRAKKLCIVVGNKSALEFAVATADTNRRFTGLNQMLVDSRDPIATLGFK